MDSQPTITFETPDTEILLATCKRLCKNIRKRPSHTLGTRAHICGDCQEVASFVYSRFPGGFLAFLCADCSVKFETMIHEENKMSSKKIAYIMEYLRDKVCKDVFLLIIKAGNLDKELWIPNIVK